jgi:hypothetical protein
MKHIDTRRHEIRSLAGLEAEAKLKSQLSRSRRGERKSRRERRAAWVGLTLSVLVAPPLAATAALGEVTGIVLVLLVLVFAASLAHLHEH